MDSADLQLVCLALAELSLRRPGWLSATRLLAIKFGGVYLFDQFRVSSARFVSETHDDASYPPQHT
jgi:hypothetical protein